MPNNKPLFVTRPYLPPRAEFEKYLDEIWQSYTLTNHGFIHNQLEDELSKMFDGSSVTLITNGHLGLDLSLHFLGITGEVITTPLTFASTTHAITWRGLTPVFCDVREDNLTIDPDKIESLITERTTAIMPVHVYGHLCDVKRIDAIANKYGLKVVYDAAHAFGVKITGKSIVDYGDVSMFSFHATKLFHTLEGGALVYKDPMLKALFEAGKNFGIYKGRYEQVGMNAKMNELQAAMGLCILPELDGLIAERKQLVMRYVEWLDDIRGIRCLVERDDEHIKQNYAYTPILVDADVFKCTRDELFDSLSKHEIHCRKYFYPLTSVLDCYEGRFSSDLTPVAEKAASQVLCLPLFNGMELSDVDRVCRMITKASV